MKLPSFLALAVALVALSLPACERMRGEEKEGEHEQHKLVATSPEARDITVTQPFVCQIRSQRNIEVCALQNGYLEAIPVKEGQAVKEGQVMFRVIPTLYQARLDAEKAEVDVAQIKYVNTKKLAELDKPVVSQQEVALHFAELAKAKAKLQLAEAELYFSVVRAPFDGIIDRLLKQQGSEVKEGDVLTNLSDNSVMWVYFNVPEAIYLEYKERQGMGDPDHPQQLTLADSKLELRLANGSKFNQPTSNTVTVEGKFNNETGNIAFRADFPNPDRLLRHGQTGTILVHRKLHNAVIIPQRATFETLDQRYVWVVGEDHVVHQRPITIEHELEDIFVVSGIDVKDKIILEGVQQVKENDKVEYEFEKPGKVLAHQKYHAE